MALSFRCSMMCDNNFSTAEADIRPSVEEIRARLPESTEEGAATSISVDVME